MHYLLAAESAGGLAALGLNTTSLIFQLVNFGILYFVLTKYAFPAILGLLKKRRETIEAGIADAAAAKEARESAEAERAKVLAEARKQASELVAAARSEAQDEAAKILANANAAANAAAESAERRIANQKAEAREELMSELGGIVAAATASVTRDELKPAADAAVIKRALNDVAAAK